MPAIRRRAVASVSALALLASLLVVAQPAFAAQKKTTKFGFPTNHTVLGFNYKVIASTHIKKLNQTITTPPGGKFLGEVDFDTSRLRGTIQLPPVKFTFSQAGVPLANVTAQIVSAKPITGTINLKTFKVTTTSTFNMRIVSAYAATPSVPGVGPLDPPHSRRSLGRGLERLPQPFGGGLDASEHRANFRQQREPLLGNILRAQAVGDDLDRVTQPPERD